MNKFLTSALVCIFLSSCAAWRVQQTVITDDFKHQLNKEPNKIKLFLSVSGYEYTENGEKAELRFEKIPELLKIVKKAYVESDLFELVKEEKLSDIQAMVELKHNVIKNKTLDIVSPATLFLVPSKKIDEVYLKTTFYTGANEKVENILGEIEKEEQIKTYRQLFLVFVMPFKPPFNIFEETLVDLNRSTLLEANDEGMFVQKIVQNVD
ncbi:MAG: hypothetical protein CME62_11310 [Halobacteriovoraceae bacterium]|nr:hypothetical protein [Halobacteriovoraceae bacterium]|tara:strand:- start:42289 stop:42915 length:627 start_codon:yes stop_codon:yes gene_type:complete